MKQKLISIIIIIVITFFLILGYNNFFTKEMLIGSYVNKNFNYSPYLVEIPYVPDTLTLYKDNQFVSNYWGKGSYNIFHTVKGTEIELTYNYKFGKAGYRTFIKRLDLGKPKIILNIDRNHYYEKLE